jgi:hypothetical protein
MSLTTEHSPRTLPLAGGTAVLCLLLGAFLKLPEAVQSPGTDTGLYATYGAMLLQGARPYVDFWDLHPPLAYAYWAFVQTLTGPDWLRVCVTFDNLAPQSCTGIVAHVVDLLLSVAAALVVGRIVRRSGGSAGTSALAAALVVGFADQVMLSQEGSNPSKLTLLPSAIAVWAYLGSLDARHPWRGAFLAGVVGAIAGLAKQPALLTLAALLGHAAWSRDRTRVTALIVGGGLTFALVCSAMACIGALDGFIAQAWVYNVQRSWGGYFQHPAKPPVTSLDGVLKESAGLLALFGLVGLFTLARAPLQSRQRILVMWTLVNLLAIVAFREFVYVVPSLAVVGALGFARVWRWISILDVQRAVVARCLLLALCAASVVATTSFQRVQLARARFERGSVGRLSPTEDLGRIIRQDLPPGPLFVYGNGAEMYPLAGRMPATRYVNAEALRSSAPGVDQTRADLVATLERSPPSIVVLAPHSDEAELNLANYPAMRMFLHDCYARAPIKPEVDSTWTLLVRTTICGPR